jgi:hypothetical protein
MTIDVVGWDDAVSGMEDIVTGDDYTVLGDDFVSGADDDLRSLLAAGDDYDVSGDELALAGAGALSPRTRMMAMAKRLAARSVARKSAVAVKNRAATAARRYPLGFFQAFKRTGNAATTSLEVDVIARPQIPFRGERLTLPSTMGVATAIGSPSGLPSDLSVRAFDFVIVDVKVGNRSQLVSSEAIPGQIFAENSFGVALRVDTAQVAQNVVIRAQYVGPLASPSIIVSGSAEITIPFRAAILGTAVY